MPRLRRGLLALILPALIILVMAGQPGHAGEPVAHIERQLGEAVIIRAGNPIRLTAGTEIMVRDRLVTPAEGRLEAAFADGTTVTLAENSELAIDAWHFAPGDGENRLFIRQVSGSVKVVAGQVHPLRLRTPVAVVGVRGTQFWAGPLEDRFGVLLIEGGITVENTSGRVDLSEPGTGIFIAAAEGPPPERFAEPAEAWIGPGAPPARGGKLSEPEPWTPDRVLKALDAVSF